MMQMLQILNTAGSLVGESPVDDASIRDLYAAMVTARIYDHKATALQRQGRLATYAPYEGQEAAQIGAVAMLEPGDWLVATYRDAAAMHSRGYPWTQLLLTRTGDERGGHPPAGVNVLPPSITVGAHMVHAVGLGWAERLKGTDAVAMTMFGDGATSEGDFHEAMNFAGVYRTPTIFVCQNNGWAISMPTAGQTASETIAQKADGYGMPGELVDGNDVLAMYDAAARAVDRARRGEGPTLIEAVTHRIQGHTTADDDGRYRSAEDTARWAERDPLERVRRYLEAAALWSQQWQEGIESAATAAIEAAVEEAESLEPFTTGEIFDAMYAEMPQPLATQRTGAAETGST
ncbi:MAG: pyruvate dehydrogenase (acetyl-transferring) E1 component subunit alpha [Acidimicrobiia bacterium]|nr:MAG: pyruvate dehydrogenase (acetyl-transferring) E1 component subunit alpha [Acidimicrobiia bacterium]